MLLRRGEAGFRVTRKTSKSFDKFETREQLYAYARAYLTRSLKRTERALVVLDAGDRKLVGKSASGLEARWWDREESLARPVIQHVIEKGEARLVVDSRKDPIFAGGKGPLSVLCVPVTGGSGRVIGFLYADNKLNEGTFNQLDLDLTKKFAQEFSLKLQELPETQPPEPEQTPEAPPEKPPEPVPAPQQPVDLSRALVTAMVLVAVILVVAISLLFFGSPAGQEVENATPADAAKGFVAMSLERNLEGAYSLLSDGMRKNRPREKFELAMEEWLMIKENEAELRSRKVVLVRSGPSSGTVYLEPSAKNKPSWEWILVREKGGWRLDHLTGGPKL
ncbi:MAG: GAF domain-containing protein [Armatimonadetes bacterium]|nr:GAF domain-containing protein [Armatimonadota bacterium]